MIFAGVDIETTGTDINGGHRLIQIAIVTGPMQIVWDVQPVGPIVYDQEALDVNHFTKERVMEAQLAPDIDRKIFDFMSKGYQPKSVTPVGFNVGGFDMAFIGRELPLTATFFTYRTLDLTALAIFHELLTGIPYRDTKTLIHKQVVERLGRDERHDALYDAEAALITVELLKDLYDNIRATDVNPNYETLGPAYFASRRISEKLMANTGVAPFAAVAKKCVDQITEEVYNYVEDHLRSDMESNLQHYLTSMVERTTRAILTGEEWALRQYPLAKNWDGASMRAAIARHCGESVMQMRIDELENEVGDLKKSLQMARNRY